MTRPDAPLKHSKTAWGLLTALFARALAPIALAAQTSVKILTPARSRADFTDPDILDAQNRDFLRKNEQARREENHAWIDAARSGDTDALRTLFARNPALLDACANSANLTPTSSPPRRLLL